MNLLVGYLTNVLSRLTKLFQFLAYYGHSFFKILRKKTQKKIFFIIFEKIQLFLIYFLYYFNFLDFFTLKSKGYIFPVLLSEFLKINLKLLDIPLFAFFCNPEHTFFLHLIITQIVMQRKQIFFTDLVKFHVITLTLLDSINRLALEYLNFFIARDLVKSLPSKIASYIYLYIYVIGFSLYFYSFFCGFFNIYPKFPSPLDIITKSSYFWLRKKKSDSTTKFKKKFG